MAVRTGSASLALPSVDRRFIVGGLLAVVSAALVLVLTQQPQTYPVLVAEEALPAGTALSSLSVGVRQVANPEGLVEGSSLGELESWVLSVPLEPGEPLLASVLLPPVTLESPNVIALSLDRAHAVLGQLSAGDLVDVYVTAGSPGDASSTRLVASDVYFVSAASSDASTSQGQVEVLLAVDDALAHQLAAAGRSGGVDLVRVGP
ncbi:MAG: RcpC/CpaB family pilus assembly protein [Acidimicrobiia bacterium]